MGDALMARVKESTGIVGLDVVSNAWEVLISLNTKTLDEVKAVPDNENYRKAVESSPTTGLGFTRKRRIGSRSRSRCGQVEEVWEKMIGEPAPNDSVSSLSFSPKANHLVATLWDNQRIS